MPKNWQLVDTNFPTFTGDESVDRKIDLIIDYLRVLIEELQYQLQNLDQSNWNANAWNSLTEDTETALAERLQTIQNSLTALKIQVTSMGGRVTTSEGRITEAENNIGYLERDMDAHTGRLNSLDKQMEGAQDEIDDLDQQINGEEGIMQLLQGIDEAITALNILNGSLSSRISSLETKTAGISVTEDGTMSIGEEGKPLKLYGQIIVNDVPMEGDS